MKNKKSKKKTFMEQRYSEQYEVRYDYQKPDGFWVISSTVIIDVPHSQYETGKDKHDEAIRIFKKKHPNARVTGVTYL